MKKDIEKHNKQVVLAKELSIEIFENYKKIEPSVVSLAAIMVASGTSAFGKVNRQVFLDTCATFYDDAAKFKKTKLN
jgi:hypothetical protein